MVRTLDLPSITAIMNIRLRRVSSVVFPTASPKDHIYTDAEIQQAFHAGWPIYFDTMTIQNLWRLHTNPRKSMIESIVAASDNCYLPFQTQLELYRHANTNMVLDQVPQPGLDDSRELISKARQRVIEEVAKVRPTSNTEGPDAAAIETLKGDIEAEFDRFDNWHTNTEKTLQGWLGKPLAVLPIKQGKSPNVLLDEIADAFKEGHLLPEIAPERRAKWEHEYSERVQRDEPVGPGLTDWKKSSLERAAGDYVMWREMVEHCRSLGTEFGFIFVTDEKKADLWERKQADAAIRRIDPRIQADVLEEVGHPMLVVSFTEFLEFTTADDDRRDMLVDISQDAGQHDFAGQQWTQSTYMRLLGTLEDWGYIGQRNVIVEASRNSGFIPRSDIGKILGWGDENGYLTRFRMPADRAHRELISLGLVAEGSAEPLWAVYKGSSEAIGYAVPDEFVGFQMEIDQEGTPT